MTASPLAELAIARWAEPVTTSFALAHAIEAAEHRALAARATAGRAGRKDRREAEAIADHHEAIHARLLELARPAVPHAAWQAALDANQAVADATLALERARTADLLDRYRRRLEGLADIYVRQEQLCAKDGNPGRAASADAARQGIENALAALELELRLYERRYPEPRP